MIGERTYGEDHYAVAIRRNNLGLLLKDLGDYRGALARARSARWRSPGRRSAPITAA